LVALGDQPQVEAHVVQEILTAYHQTRSPLVVPSYNRRRGHPWVVARALWPAVLALQPGDRLRDFLHACAAQIYYLDVDSSSVLRDLDTPGDYHRERPLPPGEDNF
jgi:molybdenum cofactor cytidylyltransferase